MPDVEFGDLVLTRTAVPAANVRPTALEAVFNLARYDCFEPPAGTIELYVKPGDPLPPRVLRESLQGDEADRVRQIGQKADPNLKSTDDAMSVILFKLDCKALPLDYDHPSYRDLLKITDCYITTIRLHVRFDVFEVKVSARVDIAVGGSTFPAGDEIATFRVSVPKDYRFEARLEFNPKCCDRAPETPPTAVDGPWLPQAYDWFVPDHFKFDVLPIPGGIIVPKSGEDYISPHGGGGGGG